MDRRRFVEHTLQLLTYCGLVSFLGQPSLAAEDELSALRLNLDEISLALRKGEIAPTIWQSNVEGLMKKCDVSELLRRTRIEAAMERLTLPEMGPAVQNVPFLINDEYRELSYITRVFGLRKQRSIMPHGHRNLVSAHTLIAGDMHVRNYQRIRDEDSSLIIEPTIDGRMAVGDCSTQSFSCNNVHWFTAISPRAYTFDVVVHGLDRTIDSEYLDFVDITNATRTGDGYLRAARLTRDQALFRYGGGSHH